MGGTFRNSHGLVGNLVRKSAFWRGWEKGIGSASDLKRSLPGAQTRTWSRAGPRSSPTVSPDYSHSGGIGSRVSSYEPEAPARECSFTSSLALRVLWRREYSGAVLQMESGTTACRR